MSGNNPLIEIIIPNWNGERLLAECLRSLSQQTFSDFRVIVVDNGSKDASVAMVERDFSQVKILKFNKNTGFSVAVNRGISEARSPWILLLNNDMEVAPDCLENLLLAIEKYKNYQFFALKMLNFYQRNVLDGAGDAVLRGGVGYRLGTMESDSEYYSRDRDTFGVCAGAGLYKRELFEKIGFFDPEFFAYLEDVDLNMRARRRGMRCKFIHSAVVYHIGSATSGSKINDLTIRLSTRNNFYVLLKNYSLWMFIRFFPAIIVFQLMWALFVCKKGMIVPYIKGVWSAAKTSSSFMDKRREIIHSLDNITEKEFVTLISSAEKDVVNSIMERRKASGKGNFLLFCYRKMFLWT